MPPIRGATQNTHSCASAHPPTNSAWPVERAGLTEVLVIGMLTRWISVSPRPMASGAKPSGARLSVVPRKINRKKKVSSHRKLSHRVHLEVGTMLAKRRGQHWVGEQGRPSEVVRNMHKIRNVAGGCDPRAAWLPH